MAVLLEALIRIFTGAAQQDLSTIRASRPRFDARMARELPLRILVAEDNTINQKLMFRLLSRLGYHADVAANGMEALESLRRQPYDVILMDVQMPEMDGTDAARAIINGWPTPQRPRIVALTAAATKEDRDGCLAAGMDDYLSKPVRMDELVAALRRCAPGIQ
ncbi:MAG: response regulator [Acidobacteria bacterium]|nr:response regulator [Acidobacteriota bacterium]